jgi:allantoate deiminase
MTPAATVMERCDVLAMCTEEPGRITRPFASDAMRRAHVHVNEWMRRAGMTVVRDNIGNLRGRYEGTGASILLLGSHLDSVRDAGRYDGPLGVLVAIAAVQQLHDAGRRLPFGLEVLAFADEEGLRYGSTYLGSRAVTGRLGEEELRRTDAGGVTMAEAVSAFGGDPAKIADDRWSGERPLGYVEVHIEQGPVLERLGLALGAVSAIAGQSRYRLTFTGEAGHAGTVPMAQRRDALVGAAAFVQLVHDAAAEQSNLVATVGQLEVRPGAANVIPGEVSLSLDVRSPDDAERRLACKNLLSAASEIADQRRLKVSAEQISERAAVSCSPRITALLRQAIGDGAVELASGAGHDGVYMSEITDIGMLFVRCKGGVSHNPAESVATEDVAVAIDVLGRFLELLAEQ